MSLFRTIPQSDFSAVDDRCLAHPGVIVDLGCDPWDWSTFFIGKKRVIGADPFAHQIEGVELFKGVIGTDNGSVLITCQGDSSTIVLPGHPSKLVRMITWKGFKDLFKIKEIAVMKINIEAAEYALLASMTNEDFAQIDQIAVSFHHFVWPAFTKSTEEALARLRKLGYSIAKTNEAWCWYLCRK